LEFDINKNPLRSTFVDAFFKTSSNLIKLGESPGLGVEVDFRAINKFRVQ
jgi:L-alanine-DL-glutamate epimerase-like enolase superfamily enzyme